MNKKYIVVGIYADYYDVMENRWAYRNEIFEGSKIECERYILKNNLEEEKEEYDCDYVIIRKREIQE
jgi:hypothetical protein